MVDNLFAGLCEGIYFSGNIPLDAVGFLNYHGREDVARHVMAVAEQAEHIAVKFSLDKDIAYCAGLLHDISLVLPVSELLTEAEQIGMDLAPEERQVPYLLHGKLSATMAEEVFGIHNAAILDAIGCHTTLRGNATPLDKVLFIADKLSWDAEHAPFLKQLEGAVEKSLDEAVSCFLTWMWGQRHNLEVIHPWLRDAWSEFLGEVPNHCKDG